MSSKPQQKIVWHCNLEDYFAKTGEKANSLSWCHKRAEEIYSKRKTFIDLPVIIGSGIIAFLNAGSSSLFDDAKISSVSLGIASLVVGMLQTINTYFNWAKRAEGHRLSSIQYSRLYRNITIELGLPREERQNPEELLKGIKDQYDRLQEISPLIPEEVVTMFQKKFGTRIDIGKPEELNGLDAISIYSLDDKDESPKRTNITLQIREASGLPNLHQWNTSEQKASGVRKSSTTTESINGREHLETATEIHNDGGRHEENNTDT